MTSVSAAPRIKFTYGNRPNRLHALTIEEDGDSDSSEEKQPPNDRSAQPSKTTNSHHPKQNRIQQPPRKDIHRAIGRSKKRKRAGQEAHGTTTAKRRVSDRLKADLPDKAIAQTAISPPINPNRHTPPVDHDLLLLLQVQKPQTSASPAANPSPPNSTNLPPQRSSPRSSAVNGAPRTSSNGGHDRKSLPGPGALPRRITRTRSQKSLPLPESTPLLTAQPIHSEPNRPSSDQRDNRFCPPPNLPQQSPQPHQSDTPDHSDILAILESTSTCNELDRPGLNPVPKKAREAAPQRRPTRTRSQKSLALSKPTQLSAQPLHSEPNPPPSEHRDSQFSQQSPQLQESDTREHSDFWAILESTNTCNNSERTGVNPVPRKARVALMGGKTTSQSGILSPSASPGCSRPTSPIARPANRLLGRVLSSSSCSDLFGPSTRTSSLAPRKPLARHLSSDFPLIPVNHEAINTSNLINLFPGRTAVKKTYGGERTFKQDENELKLLLPLSTPAPPRTSKRLSATPASSSRLKGSPKRFQSRESYSELRKKWGVDEDDEPIDGQVDLQTTIHQRASGSSKRFTDELSYLIEGLVSEPDQPDLNLKRSSAVVLVKKLKEQRFLNELRSNGLIEHFYNSLRAAGAGDGDPILDHALLIFISLLCCQDQKFIEPVLRIIPKGSTEAFSMQSDCLQLLGSVAGRDYPQAALKERGNVRRPPPLVSQIQEVVEESVLRKHFTGANSPGLLALFSLARIAMFVPRPGLLPQRAIVHCSAFASVINCLKVHSHKLDDLFGSSVPPQDFTTEDGQDILKHVGYCMDVIEACTVCEEDALNSINLFRKSLASVFGSLISLCHSLARHDQSKISMSALDILIGCLRTMVNVTNYSLIWASDLSTSSVLQALCGLFGICREGYNHHRSAQNREESRGPSDGLVDRARTPLPSLDNQVDEVVFDLLCVSLGLLANLVEQSTQATYMLRETRVQEHLPAIVAMKHPTKGPNQICGFDELIKLYIEPPCRKLDERKFIRGSISVLINLSLLNGYEDEGGEIDDGSQSINELEIIRSFKRILEHLGSDPDHHHDEHAQDDNGEGDGQSLDAEGQWESGKLPTKNAIIKSFLADLKLHSGASSSSAPALPDHHPLDKPPFAAGVVDHLHVLHQCWNRLRVELI